MKVITICGSMKFEDDIKRCAENLTLQGNCVLSLIYPVNVDFTRYCLKV